MARSGAPPFNPLADEGGAGATILSLELSAPQTLRAWERRCSVDCPVNGRPSVDSFGRDCVLG